jgi:hypothetical protein
MWRLMSDGPDHHRSDTGGQPGESDKERVDRELIEFLNEVRVVLPGVELLFAFLLTLPFTGHFAKASKAAYIVAFFAIAIAAVIMITPSAFHRIRFRRGDKEEILRMSSRLILVGIVFLGVGMVAAVWLVSGVLFSDGLAAVIAVITAAVVVGLWFLMPLFRRFAGDA